MTAVVGMKYVDHDTAAFLLEEGKPPFGLSRERLTRKKHDINFPYEPLEFIRDNGMAQDGIEVSVGDKDLSSYWRKRYLVRDWHVDDYLKSEQALRNKPPFSVKQSARRVLGAVYRSPVVKPFDRMLGRKMLYDACKSVFRSNKLGVKEFDHHACHAASAYYFSNFKDCAVLTLDGIGDNYASKVFVSEGGGLQLLHESDVSASIGHVYTSITEAMGLIGRCDEGKVEALACYGNPNTELYEKLRSQIKVKGMSVIIENKDLLKRYPWEIEAVFKPMIEKYGNKDTAAAIQRVLEEVGAELVQNVVDATGRKKIAFAGGVFANVKMNLKIFEDVKELEQMYVFPAMGDDGVSTGAALLRAVDLGWNVTQFTENEMPYFGPEFGEEKIDQALERAKDAGEIGKIEQLGGDWPARAAELAHAGDIVAIYHGRMEFGPRALGNRSIVADPTRQEIKDKLNLKVKKRKWYQPFCPSVLESERERLFKDSYKNKHMTCAFRLKEEFLKELPGIIHVDGTARPQFVEEKDNPNYFKLISEMKKLTGFGVVLNTSFNLHGRAMVLTPEDAIRDFLDCGIDHLFLGERMVSKTGKK